MSLSLRIVAVGKMKEKYLQEGVHEYIKRVKPWLEVEVVELKANRSAQKVEEALQEEGRRILKNLRKGAYIISLAEEGKQFSSETLASHIDKLLSEGNTTLEVIIGSHAGLSTEVKRQSHLLLSLSPLTFSSQLARLIFMEQLFRCMKIIKNEPYHR